MQDLDYAKRFQLLLQMALHVLIGSHKSQLRKTDDALLQLIFIADSIAMNMVQKFAGRPNNNHTCAGWAKRDIGDIAIHTLLLTKRQQEAWGLAGHGIEHNDSAAVSAGCVLRLDISANNMAFPKLNCMLLASGKA